MSLSREERLNIIRAKIEKDVKILNLSGVDYSFSPLTIGGIIELDKILDDTSNDEKISSWITLALLSIAQTMPDVDEAELNLAINALNFNDVKNTLLVLSGYVQTEKTDPKVEVAAQPQTPTQETQLDQIM